MNIQSGNVRKRQSGPVRKSGSSLGIHLAMVCRLGVVLLAAGMLANAYIYLNQKISETGREIRKTELAIHNTGREIDNLVIRKSELSRWPHISSSIKRFGLKLRPAAPGQVRRLVLYAPGVASRAASVAENRSIRFSGR